jgi:hypothetical protein
MIPAHNPVILVRYAATNTTEWIAADALDRTDTETYLARTVKTGWYMPGLGIIDQVTTHLNGQVTFRGPSGHRTFALDAPVQASPGS